MYPNPQEALPLPSRPNLDQYKKRAKDLVKACRSGDAAVTAWAAGWPEIAAHAEKVAPFARERMTRDGARCALSDAQFVIARAFGFASWPKFSAHVESLERAQSRTSVFESAVDAVIGGDTAKLGRLLREHPDLAHARSTREHAATLLIYTSANGVEGYRQKSPKNAPAVAEMLLTAGANVDATADVYQSQCTTLGLVATSEPPRIAGVQIDIIDVLLRHGARMDADGVAGRDKSLVYACLANGQPMAAEHLVTRGAPLDLAGAAGLGRVDVLDRFANDESMTVNPPDVRTREAFALACAYGRSTAVNFFLDRGMPVDAELASHGSGHTGLHVASYHGHAPVVKTLLDHRARVDAIDKTWHTAPLTWALTRWSERPDWGDFHSVVAQLVAAGAHVADDVLSWDKVRADPKMQSALGGRLHAAQS